MMRISRLWILRSVVFPLLAFAGSASAQPTDAMQLTRARETFRTGTALEIAGDWSAALAKFREVAAVRSSPQVRFHIAVCQEKLGKWTEALGTYQVARDEADAAGAKEVALEAEKGRSQLAPLIPRLKLVRGSGAQAVTLLLDGTPLGEPSIGIELRLDPGPHTIEAQRASERVMSEVVNLTSKEVRTYTVSVKGDTNAIVLTPTNGTTTTKTSPVAANAQKASLVPAAPNRTPGYVLLGVGAASAVGAGVFWFLRSGTISDLNDKCVDNRCSSDLASTSDKGKTYTGVATVATVLAVGAIGTGLYFVFRPSSSESRTGRGETRVRWLGLGGSLERTF